MMQMMRTDWLFSLLVHGFIKFLVELAVSFSVPHQYGIRTVSVPLPYPFNPPSVPLQSPSQYPFNTPKVNYRQLIGNIMETIKPDIGANI